MAGLRLSAAKPRRALPVEPAAGLSASLGGLRPLLRRGLTLIVVSGLGVAGLGAFTASTTNSAGAAYAGDSAGLLVNAAASVPVTQLASARASQLAVAGDQIADTTENVALAARSSSLSGNAETISAEIDRLKNLARFAWPTAGGVSSKFGPRLHPILRYTRLHDGDDIGGRCGQPVYAAQSGTVIRAEFGYNGGSGNNIRIAHGDINGTDVQTGYLHLQDLNVTVGQKVDKGDLIGTVGNTGLSTACHLHFSLYENGNGTEPLKYIGWNPESNRD